jgi:hypothetical protein
MGFRDVGRMAAQSTKAAEALLFVNKKKQKTF